MRVFDLSLRHKLPLWGGFLIVVSALAVVSGYLVQARGNLERNMLARSEILGRSLGNSLLGHLAHDDVWRAYEVIKGPFDAGELKDFFQVEQILVLDEFHDVFVSTQPERYPVQSRLADLGPDFVELAARLSQGGDGHSLNVQGRQILLAIPLVADGVTLGHLVLVHPAGFYWPRFINLAQRAAWITLLTLALLLPINWFWGRRLAVPLGLLVERMSTIGERPPQPLSASLYPYHDELGRLFQAYDRMALELAEKEEMKQEMVRSERLAALGRLSASVAHEINNPLGGLITAVSTLKHHAAPDPVTQRVMPLLERGLEQIREIVAALLVEARAKSHTLSVHDVEDVRLLLAQKGLERGIHLEWHNDLPESLPLPATMVRQVLINLLLNAVQSADEQGQVRADIGMAEGRLHIEIVNDGPEVPAEVMNHLFEPFTGTREEGHGLGLWVTYQIVQQLGGQIRASSRPGQTRFQVNLPLGEQQ